MEFNVQGIYRKYLAGRESFKSAILFRYPCKQKKKKKKKKGRKALSMEGLLSQCSSGEFGSCQHIEGTQLKYLCYAQLLAGSCLGKVCFCVNTKASHSEAAGGVSKLREIVKNREVGVLQSMGWQRVRQDLMDELQQYSLHQLLLKGILSKLTLSYHKEGL